VELQNQAVKYAREVIEYRACLETYRSLAGQTHDRDLSSTPPAEGNRSDALSPSPTPLPVFEDWSERLAALDWYALGQGLTRDGCVLIGRLVDAETCAHLRGLFAEDARFSKTVVMDRPAFGRG